MSTRAPLPWNARALWQLLHDSIPAMSRCGAAEFVDQVQRVAPDSRQGPLHAIRRIGAGAARRAGELEHYPVREIGFEGGVADVGLVGVGAAID